MNVKSFENGTFHRKAKEIFHNFLKMKKNHFKNNDLLTVDYL